MVRNIYKSAGIVFLLILCSGFFCTVKSQTPKRVKQGFAELIVPIVSDKLIVLEQIGSENNLHLRQINGTQNWAQLSQYGYGNQAKIAMAASSRNIISMRQRGQQNHIDFSLVEGVDHRIQLFQDQGMNIIDVMIGKAHRANIGISQRGGGYIKLDAPNYQHHRGLNLRGLTIKQSKGGVPIIIKNGSN